jgi:hypothetical protein
MQKICTMIFVTFYAYFKVIKYANISQFHLPNENFLIAISLCIEVTEGKMVPVNCQMAVLGSVRENNYSLMKYM